MEHICAWMETSTRKDTLEPTHWDNFVTLIQATFWEGHLLEECTLQTNVLIQKGNGDLRNIGLVYLLWKTVMGILNYLLTLDI